MAKAKPGLTRDRVLAAALKTADADGLEAISMRSLGATLGVEAMSLYNHVKNKDDLIGGLCERAWREVELPVVGTPWREGVAALARSTHEMLLAHPWMLARTGTSGGLPQMTYINTLLGIFREDGFSAEVTYHAQHVLDGYVFGFTQEMVSYGASKDTLEQDVEQLKASGVLEGMDYLQEHIGQHLEAAPAELDSGFDTGLTWILDGLAKAR